VTANSDLFAVSNTTLKTAGAQSITASDGVNNFTAAQSGMVTFASSAGALVMKPVAQRMLRLFGFRDTLVWNGLLSAALLAVCAAFRPTWPAAAIYAALLVGGFFRSLQFTAYNTLAYGDVPRERVSAATSLYTAGQQLAATIGISAGAAVGVTVVYWTGGQPQAEGALLGAAFLALGAGLGSIAFGITYAIRVF